MCPSLVNGNCCLATKGKGRLFVPEALIAELSGTYKSKREHVIAAAPGLPPIPEPVFSANNRSGVLEGLMKHWDWYWKTLVDAMKPVDDYIPERYVKAFRIIKITMGKCFKCD